MTKIPMIPCGIPHLLCNFPSTVQTRVSPGMLHSEPLNQTPKNRSGIPLRKRKHSMGVRGYTHPRLRTPSLPRKEVGAPRDPDLR